MSPIFQGDELYRTRADILALMLSDMQTKVPDIWIGEDGNFRILCEVESSQIEGVFLANQILLEDMYIQTANYAALLRWGATYAVDRKNGTISVGQLMFSGTGGTYIPIG